MSEEHLWSSWMAPLLPQGQALQHVEYAEKFRGRVSLGNPTYRTKHGSAATKRYKVVCKRCNETWMSGMETMAKPRLIPLIKGQPTLLNDRDRQMVADWIMLKVLIAEHTAYSDFPAEPLYSKEDYEYFMLLRQLPFGVRIWIGHHTGTKWKSAIFGHSAGILPPHVPPPEPPMPPKNTHAITLGIGSLLIHVLMTTAEPVYSWLTMGSLVPPFRLLWPLTPEDIRWLPLHSLTDAEADQLVNSFDDFISGPHVQYIGD